MYLDSRKARLDGVTGGGREVGYRVSNLVQAQLAWHNGGAVPDGRLFTARAAAAAPGFSLDGATEETHEAVAEICRRLDGIPGDGHAG